MKRQEDLPKEIIDARNEIFITYANNLIINCPENLRKLSEKIKEFGRCLESLFPEIKGIKSDNKFYYKSVTDLIPRFISHSFDILAEIIRIDDWDLAKSFYNTDNIAFFAAYMFSETGCFACQYNNLKGEREKNCIELYGTFKGSPDIKRHIRCYECDQAAFIKMLDRICNGESIFLTEMKPKGQKPVLGIERLLSPPPPEYIGIEHFTQLLFFRNIYTKHMVYENDGELKQIITPSFISFNRIEFIFNDYIKAIMGYSFISFFLDDENNLKRLKLCPYCNMYFIAKDLKRTFCYSLECKREFWRIDKKKRRKNKLRRSKKKMIEKKMNKKEKKIKKLMKNLEIGRDEATKLYEDDKGM